MAGTATPDTRHNISYSLMAAQHYGLKIQCGVYTPCTGTTQYTTVGDSLVIPGIATPLMVAFGMPGSVTATSTRATVYVWDATNESVRWLITTTGGPTECTTAQGCEGLTAPYLAIGY
jgi:hypothetical protein